MVAASSMQYDFCKDLIKTYKADVTLSSQVDGNTVLHVLGDTRGLQKEQEKNYVEAFLNCSCNSSKDLENCN